MTERDPVSGLLSVLGLGLAALGQYYFAFRRQYVWDGALFWAAGIALLGLAMRRLRRKERGISAHDAGARQGWLSDLREHPDRSIAAGGGLALSFIAGWWARNRPPEAGFVDLLAVWLIGVGSFLIACVPSHPTLPEMWERLVRRGELGTWLRRNSLEVAGLSLLLFLALVVRAYDLEHIPANLGGDEGTWAMEGLAMLDGRLANPFATRWFAFPSMSFLVWGLSMRVFGETVAGVRTVSALIGTASVLTTFFLAKELWNRRVAWLAAVALAVGHYHLHFSRLAVNNIADSLLVTSALYFLVRGLRSRSLMSFGLAGATIGAGWYGYFGARLLGILAAVYVAWRAAAEHRFLARYRRQLLVLIGAILVVAAPLLMYYASYPKIATEGLDRVSILGSGWLSREQEFTGRNVASLLLQQFWKSISAFHYTLDPTFWYRAEIPLLDAVSGVLFVLGLIWCVGRWRWPSSALLLIWFWLALFTGWVLTENPPSSQRMIILTPALALLVALGLDRLLHLWKRILGSGSTLQSVLVGVLVMAIAGLNLGFYFLSYTPKRVYANVTSEIATRLARYLERQDDDYVVYFHGSPLMYWDYGALRFMARGVPGVDVPPLEEGGLPGADLSRGARFVFHPARIEELDDIRARYPGGTATQVRSDADGEVLYAMYEIER